MNVLRAAMHRLYRVMLACYPAGVRREYGEEMLQVFCRRSADRAEGGIAALFVLFLHELWDWPTEVLRAHRDEHLMGGLPQMKAVQAMLSTGLYESEGAMMTSDEFAPGSDKEALWMSAPPFLLGMGVMIAALLRTDVWYRLPAWQLYLSVAITLLPGLIVAVVGLIALIRRIPDWGLTWLASAFMGTVLTVQVFLGELVDEGTITLDPILETVLGLGFFFAGLALLLIIAARGWSRSGLFTLAAAATMGLSLLQSVTAAPINRDDIALLAGPLGMVFALLIYLYCRKAGVIRWAALAITSLLNFGVVLVIANAWSEWRPSLEANSFIPALLILITGLLLSGPISGLLMKPILRRWT